MSRPAPVETHGSGNGAARRSPWLVRPVLIAAAIPLLALIVLYVTDAPLGRPRFVYPYSPLAPIYLLRAIPALLLIVPLVHGARALASTEAAMRRRGLLIGATTAVLIGGWSFAAPYRFRGRYLFEMQSPSHDGAFLLEAHALHHDQIVTADRAPVLGADEYVRRFPELLKRTPVQMRGTRVLSNPPGMTMLALAAIKVLDRVPLAARLVQRCLPGAPLEDAALMEWFTQGLSVASLLHVIWMLSLLPAYGLARLWLARAPALVTGLAMVFNPATVNFTPGKDAAQLLLVLALLYLWFAVVARRSLILAVLAGVVWVIGMLFSLVFAWIALVAAISSLWVARRDRRRVLDVVLHAALPAAISAVVVMLLACAALRWNVAATLYAVAARYGELQGDIITRPLLLNLIGLGLFVLFAGPALWTAPVILWRQRATDEAARLGRVMLVLTTIVLSYTYMFANNAETPRLWIPFIPLLVLGVVLQADIFRAPGREGSVRVLLALLAIQVAATLAHRSLLDVRETELRALSGRGYL